MVRSGLLIVRSSLANPEARADWRTVENRRPRLHLVATRRGVTVPTMEREVRHD